MHPERPIFRIVTSAGEAEEHLRVIRQAMERSTKHSTLSGLSGVTAGLLALAGCALTQTVVRGAMADSGNDAPNYAWRYLFVGVWAGVLVLAILADYVFAKRRAARVGKTATSPLARHLFRAAAPGLVSGIALCLFYVLHPTALGSYIYGAWMLCYGVSVLAVGMFSLREVSILGWLFLAAGCVTLLLPPSGILTPRSMMAIAFGGFHIVYGVWMGNKYGW